MIIDHGGGVATVYAHLSTIEVTAGVELELGESVGAIGSTGLSTGPHLHFEVWANGGLVNPLDYLP